MLQNRLFNRGSDISRLIAGMLLSRVAINDDCTR